VRLDVLFQILRTLEGLAAVLTFVRLEWDVDADVRRDVVALHGGSLTLAPSTAELEIVCGLAPNMTLANMLLRGCVSGG
jgi:hypothetical protein